MAKLAINLSGITGLAPRFYGDKPKSVANTQLRYLGGEGQMADGIYNPISLLGFMSPASDTTKAVTGTTSFLLTTALLNPGRLAETNTNTIFFGDQAESGTQGQIVELDTAVDTALGATHTLAQISSTDTLCEDMILYQVNGIGKVFFVHALVDRSAGGYIGIATRSFASIDDNWSANTPIGASTILLKNEGRKSFVLADNAFLYVLDANTVHRIDGGTTGGTNGTIVADVLVFLGTAGTSGAGTITNLVDGIDLRGRMWIGLHVNAGYDPATSNLSDTSVSQFTGVYVWDRRSTVASMQDFIEIIGVRELKTMFKLQGNPGCFTISTDGYTQLRMWSGAEFKVAATFGKNAYPPYGRHSIYESGDMITWLGQDGIIYAFGKIESGMKNATYKLGDMTGHVSGGETYVNSGILLAVNATESVTSGNNTTPLAFYISFTDTAGNHLVKWYPDAYDPADIDQKAHTGETKTLVNVLPKLSDIRGLTLHFPSVGSGGSTELLDVKIYINMSSSAVKTETLTQDDAKRGWKWIPYKKRNVNAIQIGLTWKAENLANNIAPYVAVVEYDPTDKNF